MLRDDSTHVLLCDQLRSRRVMLARMFRAAGCVVREVASEAEVDKTLGGCEDTSWLLAVAGTALSSTFCDTHPGVPLLRLGSKHRETMGGRVNVPGRDELSENLHSLVGTRVIVS